MKRMPALSLRQPNAEQVLRGKKKIEYRSMPTSKRERVYLCEQHAGGSGGVG
jgi:ASCH domain